MYPPPLPVAKNYTFLDIKGLNSAFVAKAASLSGGYRILSAIGNFSQLRVVTIALGERLFYVPPGLKVRKLHSSGTVNLCSIAITTVISVRTINPLALMTD